MGFMGQGFNFGGMGGVLPIATPTEDLSTYTEVDEHSDLTVSASTLTLTSIAADHATSYLYYDFGVGYFKADCVINFEVIVTSVAVDNTAYGLIKLANALGTNEVAQGPTAYLRYCAHSGSKWEFASGDSTYATSYRDINKLGAATYYCTMERKDHTAAPNDGEVNLYVYSDASRTSIMEGVIPRNDIPEATASTLYRYLLIGQTSRAAHDATPEATYLVKNIKIVSNG